MAIAKVQDKSGTFTNSPSGTLAYDTNVTAGNLLVCVGGAWTGGTTFTTAITDSLSNTYSVLMGPEGIERTWMAYCISGSSGACTVTIDPSEGGAYAAYNVSEWSGVDATPLDVDGGTSTGSSTTPSDSLTTSATDTMVVGVMSHFDFNDDTLTPDTGGGWTQLAEYELSASIANYNCEYQLFSSAGAKTASWTIGNSRNWGAQTASFKATPAGADVGTFRLDRFFP
jgi:hypothetical protein